MDVAGNLCIQVFNVIYPNIHLMTPHKTENHHQ